MDWITEVWTIPAILAAIIGGFALGVIFFGRLGFQRAAFMVSMVTLIGGVFYSGQILDTVLSDPTHGERVTSRFAIWVIYAVAIFLGAALENWVTDRPEGTI